MINLSRVNNQQGFAIPAAPAASLLASKPSSSSRMTDTSSMLAQALSRVVPRRPRGEKKPIPDEQKDERYFERRKRNNLAAKKSRDQRKMREDAISLRASFLEKENALMRTQVSALREERNSLQGLLLRRQLAVKHREMLNVLVVEQQQKQVQYLELLKQHEAEAAAAKAAKASTSQQKEPKESLPQQQQEIVDLTVSKNKEENHRAHETSLPTTSTEEKVQSET